MEKHPVWKLTRANTLWEIADIAFEILGNPVFFVDMNHMILAYTKNPVVNDPLWEHGIVQGNLEGRTLDETSEVRRNHKLSADEDRPILVPSHREFPHSRIVRTILSGGIPVGVFVDSGTFRDCTESDMEYVDIIAAIALPLIEHKYGRPLRQSKVMGNFLIGLLDGAIETEESLQKRMKSLNIKDSNYHYVLAFAPGVKKIPTQGDAEVNSPKVHELVRSISDAIHAEAFLYDDQIVCIPGVDKPITHWVGVFPKLDELISTHGLNVGVSRYFSSLSELRTHYLQALSALDIGSVLLHPNPWLFFDELAMYRMFRDEGSALAICCSQKIRDLDAYDKIHGTELCVTLQIWLENWRNLSRTAEILFIHKNTARYRINKCMSLLFDRPENEEDLFPLLLSLRILEYEKKTQNA